jgi:hypothetical protein
MIYFLLISIISLAILAFLLWRAPRGWQDEDGFHLGEQSHRPIDVPPLVTEPVPTDKPIKAPERRRLRKAA